MALFLWSMTGNMQVRAVPSRVTVTQTIPVPFTFMYGSSVYWSWWKVLTSKLAAGSIFRASAHAHAQLR